MENPNNRIIAVGRLEGGLELSHEVMNEPFYTGTLLVKRLSGAVDRLPVTIPGKLMGMLPQEDVQLVMRRKGSSQYLFALNYMPEERTVTLKQPAVSLYTGEECSGNAVLPPFGTAVWQIRQVQKQT